MKRNILLILLAAVLVSPAAWARAAKYETVKLDPASPEILYTGRTMVQDGAVVCNWSGVYAQLKFEGSALKINCRTDRKVMLNVWVDNPMGAEADLVVTVGQKDSSIVLASGLGKGQHKAFIQKRSEGGQGTLFINSYELTGKLLPADPGKERLIEVIGDSYTCGYGTEPSHKNDPFKVETENCNYAYGCIIARYFDADYRLVSHSGIGVARNFNDGGKYTMVDLYSRTLDTEEDCPAWDHKSARKPDVVIIYLGTNDFSRGKAPTLSNFCKKYKSLIDQVKSAYGESVPVVCVGSRIDEMAGTYVKEAVERCGHSNVSWMQFNATIHNNEDELGASNHPNYRGQKKKAMALIPYVATATGWQLEDKPVR